MRKESRSVCSELAVGFRAQDCIQKTALIHLYIKIQILCYDSNPVTILIFFSALPYTRNAGKVVTMSGGLDVLQMKEEDVLKFLAASTHLGGTNLDFQMEQYVYKRKSDGESLHCGVTCSF